MRRVLHEMFLSEGPWQPRQKRPQADVKKLWWDLQEQVVALLEKYPDLLELLDDSGQGQLSNRTGSVVKSLEAIENAVHTGDEPMHRGGMGAIMSRGSR